MTAQATGPGRHHARLLLCWGCVPNAGLPELVSLASCHGFGEISITLGHYRRTRASGWSDASLRRLLADGGVSVGIIDPLLSALPGMPMPAEVNEAYRELFGYQLADCLGAAAALGSRTLNMAHFLGRPTALNCLADGVATTAAAAAQWGVQVSLEFIPDTGVPDLRTARDVIARAGAPANAGLMFDTWHFMRSDGRVEELDDLSAHEVLELQISDRRAPPPGTPYVPMTDRLAPGDGEAPLMSMLRRIVRCHPSIVTGVEVFTAEATDPDQVVADLSRKTLAVMEALCS